MRFKPRMLAAKMSTHRPKGPMRPSVASLYPGWGGGGARYATETQVRINLNMNVTLRYIR